MKIFKKMMLLFAAATVSANMFAYDLTICGVQITDDNCNTISKIDGITLEKGSVIQYLPKTKTLYVQNVTIDAGNMNAIVSKIDGLTLQISGYLKVTSNNFPAISFYKDGKITSSMAEIYVNGAHTRGIFIEDNVTVTIENTIINAPNTNGVGIGGKNTTKLANLVLDKVKGDIAGYSAAIRYLASLTLKNCEITTADAKFIASNGGVCADGNYLTSLTLAVATSGIDGVVADEQNTAKEGTYTISGVRVSDDFESLPAGLYIINGKKVMKK